MATKDKVVVVIEPLGSNTKLSVLTEKRGEMVTNLVVVAQILELDDKRLSVVGVSG